MKKVRQTSNPILRLWGNLSSYMGNWFFGQAEKYADLYELDEDFLFMLGESDGTGVWQGDEQE